MKKKIKIYLILLSMVVLFTVLFLLIFSLGKKNDNQFTNTTGIETQTINEESIISTENSTTKNNDTVTSDVQIETTSEIIETTTVETTSNIIIETTMYKKGEYDFDELKIVKLEFSDWEKLVDRIFEIDKTDNIEELDKSINSLVDFYEQMTSLSEIIEIKYYSDTSNPEIKDLLNYYSNLKSDISENYVKTLYKLLIESNHMEYIKDNISKEDYDFVMSEVEKMVDDYTQVKKDIDALKNKYNGLSSTIKVTISGKEYDIEGIQNLFNPLTYFNYQAYVYYLKAYYKEYVKEASNIYIELMGLYKKLAYYEGYDNVEDYFNKKIYGREYSSEEIDAYLNYVKKYISSLNVPKAIDDETFLRNTNDIKNALNKYKDTYIDYFASISDEMIKSYEYMNKFHLLRVNTGNNAPSISFTTAIDFLSLPVISIKDDDDFQTVRNFIHEFGHFYSYYISPTDHMLQDIDSSEIVSQTNEILFGIKKYKEIFPKYYNTLFREDVYSLLRTIINSAVQYKFQKESFKLENPTRESLGRLYQQILIEYNYESYNTNILVSSNDYWVMYSHQFVSPFYYLSYGLSAMPVFDIIYIAKNYSWEETANLFNKIAYYNEDTAFMKIINENNLHSPFDEETFKFIALEYKNKNLLTIDNGVNLSSPVAENYYVVTSVDIKKILQKAG